MAQFLPLRPGNMLDVSPGVANLTRELGLHERMVGGVAPRDAYSRLSDGSLRGDSRRQRRWGQRNPGCIAADDD